MSRTSSFLLKNSEAENIQLSDTQSTSVTLNFWRSLADPPTLKSDDKKVAIDINQTALLSCRSHAVPVPSFRWYKGTTQLFQGPRIQVSTCPVLNWNWSTQTDDPGSGFVHNLLPYVTSRHNAPTSCLVFRSRR